MAKSALYYIVCIPNFSRYIRISFVAPDTVCLAYCCSALFKQSPTFLLYAAVKNDYWFSEELESLLTYKLNYLKFLGIRCTFLFNYIKVFFFFKFSEQFPILTFCGTVPSVQGGP
jgi:hypothetical protein